MSTGLVTTIVVSSLDNIVPTQATPLTTTFTPASSCVDRWLQPISTSPTIYSSALYDAKYAECQAANQTQPVFSPGLCPSGHRLATITQYLKLPEASDQSHRLWKGVCCSNGMSLATSSSCYSYFAKPVVALRPFALNITAYNSGTPVATTTTTVYEWTTQVPAGRMGQYAPGLRVDQTTLTQGVMYAQALDVYWRVKDLNSFNSEYASSLAKDLGVQVPALTTAASAASSSPSSSAQPPLTPPSSGLSTGAKIGIGLGTVLGVLLLAALGLYFLCARKRRGKAARNTQPDGAEQGQYLPEMEDQDREHAERRLFAQGGWRAEADGRQKPGELHDASSYTKAAPVELEARRPA